MFTDPTGMSKEGGDGIETDIYKLYDQGNGEYRAEKKHINDGENNQIYLVMGEDGTATNMYQGKEALSDMYKDGKVKKIDYGQSTLDLVKEAAVDFWTSDEYRTKAARETMVNYATSVIPFEGVLFGMFGNAAKTILPRSGPIIKTVGAASRSEMLARKLKLNLNSPTTRQVLNSLDDTVESFISQYRTPSIRGELPGEFLKGTVEEALKSGNTTVRKLLIDNRFIK